MVQGIFIPAENWLPPVFDEYDGLASYQEAVDGYIEPISIATPPLSIFVNEDGKVRRYPVNDRATFLWWLLAPEARGHDFVVGNAVVIASGPSSLADQFLSQLAREDATFRVEIRPATSVWGRVDREQFSTWFMAARRALALDHFWLEIAEVRVVQN